MITEKHRNEWCGVAKRGLSRAKRKQKSVSTILISRQLLDFWYFEHLYCIESKMDAIDESGVALVATDVASDVASDIADEDLTSIVSISSV